MSGAAGGGIGLAFLGCGSAARMHTRTLRRVAPDARLHYASRDASRAEAFRARHGGAGAFGSYREAIADPGIDAVLVVTPPDSHLELTLEALEAGKDVIVEKPAYPRPDDFGPVREAVARTGRRVLVAENYFYKPLRERLERIVAEGVVGDPLFLRVNAVKRQEAEGWRADPERAGGGALMEGGIHWINLMAGLGLEVERVHGFRPGRPAGARDGDHGPVDEPGAGRAGPPDERSALVVFEYAGGAVGTLAYSWEVPSPLRGLRISRIHGTRGSVTFESNGVFVFVHGERTRFHVPRPWDISGYRAMFEDFLGALRTGREPRMTLEMAERDVRLVHDAYRSFRTRPGEDG